MSDPLRHNLHIAGRRIAANKATGIYGLGTLSAFDAFVRAGLAVPPIRRDMVGNFDRRKRNEEKEKTV